MGNEQTWLNAYIWLFRFALKCRSVLINDLLQGTLNITNHANAQLCQ